VLCIIAFLIVLYQDDYQLTRREREQTAYAYSFCLFPDFTYRTGSMTLGWEQTLSDGWMISSAYVFPFWLLMENFEQSYKFVILISVHVEGNFFIIT
jgi:hypothetical protein